MLIVKSFGGLGNQIFQYAFYLYLKQNNKEIYLDISDFEIHNHHHGFELQKVFGVSFDVPSKKQILSLSYNQNSILYRVLQKTMGIRLCKKTEVFENTKNMFISNIEEKFNMYYVGFWQNSRYIQQVASELHRNLIFRNTLTGKNHDLLNILKDNTTVSIHIRRGDYLKVSQFSNICTIDYYNKAINYINQKIQNPTYIIFSDDIDWTKENLNLDENAIFVDWNTGDNSYIDMQLMSLCSHNIIANSTFSWWGAWLNNNPNKITICPEIWSHDCKQNYLLCDDWISIK